jgi:hypothetical protein
MQKIKEYKGIIIIILILILGAFYWFQVRPTQIRKECAKNSKMFAGADVLYKGKYENCLQIKGLEK